MRTHLFAHLLINVCAIFFFVIWQELACDFEVIMLKFINIFIFFVTIILCSHTQIWAATKPQGMEVYGTVAPHPSKDPSKTTQAPPATEQRNNQGFQVYPVNPPKSNTQQTAPALIQPNTDPLAAPQTTQGQGSTVRQSVTPKTSNAQKAPAPTEAEMKKTYDLSMRNFAKGNYQEAINTWKKLANDGYAPAMIGLGLMNDNGSAIAKIPVNTKEALIWFRKAADLGHRDGMYHLGRMLVHGRGDAQGKKYPDTAAQWFRKAADLAQHDAQYALGVLYENGNGVVGNIKHAVSWYSLAAAGQNVPALARLGHFYRVGKGVPKNAGRATLLLYGATMAGNAAARQELYNMALEHFGDKKMPRVTLFGLDLAGNKGITRSAMRAALSVSQIPPKTEDIKNICDVYAVTPKIPGAKQMAACYGAISPNSNAAEQELGFVIIDYPVKEAAEADVIHNMVAERFGPPTAGEKGRAFIWNLGNAIVATQYSPTNKEVGLMYIIPRVYHMTQGKK